MIKLKPKRTGPFRKRAKESQKDKAEAQKGLDHSTREQKIKLKPKRTGSFHKRAKDKAEAQNDWIIPQEGKR